ncbi:MAG TPA: hypothetical protein VNP04_28215 [Alphaproteobacteria bacterium]|nr:hypothetical protein [Alphaproteobacteria bacterium]
MNRTARLLAVSLVVGVAVLLAIMPLGNVSQPQRGLVASLVGPDIALARLFTRVISPEFEPPLELEAQGRLVTTVGHIACTEGELFRIQVTVTQLAAETDGESDGALAEGSTQGFCTGDVQTWTVEARARASTVFDLGPVRACALATTQGGGPINDAFQWCADVVLVPAAVE